MYLIINSTTNKTSRAEGSFPIRTLEKMLLNEEKVIVISLYSNTIKVPYRVDHYYEPSWEWDEYHFDPRLLTTLFIQYELENI